MKVLPVIVSALISLSSVVAEAETDTLAWKTFSTKNCTVEFRDESCYIKCGDDVWDQPYKYEKPIVTITFDAALQSSKFVFVNDNLYFLDQSFTILKEIKPSGSGE